MFLVNSRLGLVTAAPSRSRRKAVHATGAPLLPKLRGQFAEFLDGGSPVHLGLLDQPTCVGLRYGRAPPWLEAFLGSYGLNPLRLGRRPVLALPPRSSSERICLSGHPTGLDGARGRRDLAPCVPPSLITARSRGTGILTRCPSPTALRPRLRPDSPAADQPGCGTLGHSVGGILTPLALLMPAFALPAAPPSAPASASPLTGTLPYHAQRLDAAHPRLRCRA